MEVVFYSTAGGNIPYYEWFERLKDTRAKVCLMRGIDNIKLGKFDNLKPLTGGTGRGISELRVDIGIGYRVYCFKHAESIVVLCGGDKNSQNRDIAKAKQFKQHYLKRLKGGHYE